MASSSEQNDIEVWNDPEFVEEVIKETQKREREYEITERAGKFIKGKDDTKKSKQTNMEAFFPLISQVNVTSFSKIYVAKYIPGQPMPPCPNKGKNVLIHTSNKYLGGSLSPYHLKDENGNLLENIWQFSKVYYYVSGMKTALSKFHPDKIIWEHQSETHVNLPALYQINESYWAWRKKGTSNPYAVRYPNGYRGRTECMYALWPKDKCAIGEDVGIMDPEGIEYKKLDYIQARKVIYCGEYARLAPLTKCFQELKKMMNEGMTIQIVEVDGPDVSWYKNSDISGAIKDKSLAISKTVIEYLLNDVKHPFGHGYVITALLLGGTSWITA